MKGQLSAEMLILVVVIMAVIMIAATQLIGTAKDTGKSITEKTAKINDITDQAIKAKTGETCITSDDCESGSSCENYVCG